VTFIAQTAITVATIATAFYGFWLVWRVLMPVLPGPRDLENGFSPFGKRFTDPLITPIARVLRVPDALIAGFWLIAAAALITALNGLSASLKAA
jgi:hypothetical protein